MTVINKLKTLSLVFSLVAMIGIASPATAQNIQIRVDGDQIEVLDKNGNKIKSDAIEIKPSDEDGDKKKKVTKVKKIIQKDGKIFIHDGSGGTKVIDVGKGVGITLNQAVETIVEDGEQTIKSVGKVVIVGPDGVRHETELDDIDSANLKLGGLNGWLTATTDGSNFFVGLACDSISPAMAAQLSLESGTGLVVNKVVPDSPAEKAGFQLHDVLKSTDGNAVANQTDLVKAVQEAGKNDKELAIVALRAGKEIAIKVKPTKREGGGNKILMAPSTATGTWLFGPGQEIELKHLGPGVIAEGALKQQQEQLEKVLGRLKKQTSDLRDESIELQMKEMREQMSALRKEMRELLDKKK